MHPYPLLAVLALLLLPAGLAGTGAPFDLVAVRGVPPLDLGRYGEEGSAGGALPPGVYYFAAAVPVPCHGETTVVRLEAYFGWSAPAFVVRNYATQPFLEDFTGGAAEVGLQAACEGSVLRTKDLFVLPAGQLGMWLFSSVRLEVDGRVYLDEDAFAN